MSRMRHELGASGAARLVAGSATASLSLVFANKGDKRHRAEHFACLDFPYHHNIMYFGRKAEPKSSKLLYEREIAEKQRRHRQRLRNMKASVDNRAPKRPKHM